MPARSFAIACLCLATTNVNAQTNNCPNLPSTHYCSGGIFMDQDLFVDMFKLGEDRNYTMGLGLYYSSSGMRTSGFTAPVRWISSKLFPQLDPQLEQSDNRPFVYSAMLANGTFTPDDLRSYDVIRDDRPYANVTYLQENMTRVTASNNGSTRLVKHSSSLGIGMLGTGISRAVQSEIHSWSNKHDSQPPYTPRGWPHEISNRGEPTLLLTRSSEKLLTSANAIAQNRGKWSAELKHGWKYSLGWYTGAEYNFNIRLGFLDALNWTYDINPLTNSNNVAGNLIPLYTKQTRGEIYILAAARPTFMLYNALLNGQFKKSDYTIDFYHMRHLFLQWDLGIAGKIPLGCNSALDLKWRIISARTAEFELPGRDPRTHYWGGIDAVFTHYK